MEGELSKYIVADQLVRAARRKYGEGREYHVASVRGGSWNDCHEVPQVWMEGTVVSDDADDAEGGIPQGELSLRGLHYEVGERACVDISDDLDNGRIIHPGHFGYGRGYRNGTPDNYDGWYTDSDFWYYDFGFLPFVSDPTQTGTCGYGCGGAAMGDL